MANENMIQKHEDNFLAKIAGETPIDDNPRNSTEFWLNEIAENLPGGGTTVVANPTLAGTEDPLTGLQVGDTKYSVGEKLYQHIITMGGGCGTVIINNSSTKFNLTSFVEWLYDHNFRTPGTNNSLCTSGLCKITNTEYAMGVYAISRTQSSIGWFGYEITIVDNAIQTTNVTGNLYNMNDNVVEI